MNIGTTLTVQSNQTDLFKIIMSVINCTSFSMKEVINTLFQCPVSVFIGTGFYRYWLLPVALLPYSVVSSSKFF